MPRIKQRIKSLEHRACGRFSGCVVISSREYDTATGADELARYLAANGPVTDGKQVVLIGWAV